MSVEVTRKVYTGSVPALLAVERAFTSGDKMKRPHRLGMLTLIVAVVSAGAFLSAPPTFAQSAAEWERTKKECGLSPKLVYNNWDGRCPARETGNAAPSDNRAAAQRADEERLARERSDREAEEKRLKQEADQRAFEASRDEGAKSLKGSGGTRSYSNSPNEPGIRGSGGQTGDQQLKGSRADTGIHTGKPNRDFSGPYAAWKELFCAASILNSAIVTLNIDGQGGVPDYSAFKKLAAEAGGALEGEVRGVPCAAAPDFPKFSGTYSDPAKLTEAGKRLLNNIVSLADRMDKASEAKSTAQAEMNKPAPVLPPAKPGSDVVAEQRRINAVRAEEAKRIAKAQSDFNAGKIAEDAAKANMAKVQKDVEKAVEDPESFGILLENDAPESSTNKAPPTTKRSKP